MIYVVYYLIFVGLRDHLREPSGYNSRASAVVPRVCCAGRSPARKDRLSALIVRSLCLLRPASVRFDLSSIRQHRTFFERLQANSEDHSRFIGADSSSTRVAACHRSKSGRPGATDIYFEGSDPFSPGRSRYVSMTAQSSDQREVSTRNGIYED